LPSLKIIINRGVSYKSGGIKPIMSNKLYNHICKKYPNIEYKGEDLNLENLYTKELKKRWLNTNKYPTVTDIVIELRISERTVYRLAKENNLGSRWTHRKNNQL
jgi:hypothetical protein